MSNNLNYNLTRLSLARTNIASAITAKGGTVGNDDGFEDFVSDIATIPGASVTYGTVIATSDASSTFISETYFDTDTYAYRTNNTIIFYIHMKAKNTTTASYRQYYYSYIGISGLLNSSETVNLNSGFLITQEGNSNTYRKRSFDSSTVINNQVLVINGSTSFYLGGTYYPSARMIGCIEIN